MSDEEPRSAMQVAEDEPGIPVRAVLKFEDIVEAVESGKIKKQLKELRIYREKYGSRD